MARMRPSAEELFVKAATRNFGTAPTMDSRLVSCGGDRAEYFRSLLRVQHSLTIRQLSDAWAERQGVVDRVEVNKLHKRTIKWVKERVAAGELEEKGNSGDEFGSKLYGFVLGETR